MTTKALQRNRFYPRKLMEVRHWQAEQVYHRRARELVTQLGLGTGVLCGLDVTLTGTGTLEIGCGVGVDGCGRIVVVPGDIEVDPRRLTDACGRPSGETADDGGVTVWLCFHECGTDLVPLPPELCNDEVSCIASMTREAYAVLVTRDPAPPVGLPPEVCEALFHPDRAAGEEEDQESLHALLDRLDPRNCAPGPVCIPLAAVEFGGYGGTTLDTGVRTVIRSNRNLLDLILCLADRVDNCCDKAPSARPPRLTALWPWPDPGGAGLRALAAEHRLEVGFDRDMAEQGLDDPEPWLGVWLLGPRLARRLPVTRASGGLGYVTTPTGGDAAAFAFEVEPKVIRDSTVIVVMARATASGPIRAAGPDQLALDAELAATGLSIDQRAKLWAMAADGTNVASLGAFAKHAVQGPPPWLPSGDGTAGGELHVVYRPAGTVRLPPQLLDVWPPGGSTLDQSTPESADLWQRFLKRPRLEIVVSRALAAAAVAGPKPWLRMWHATPDGDRLYALREVELAASEEETLGDDTVRLTFPLRADIEWFRQNEMLVQLRSTPPVAPGSPVGLRDPLVLLDADVAGTRLDSQTLFTIWSGGAFPEGLPTLQATSTQGRALYDGVEGGLAHWGFRVLRPDQV
ncbi:hypothetical protein [Streptomyces sp. NPDC006446]|uniref:hypothetical protein n=1 Tax=Streptomyces sp. NPDC006446 TaxID=3154301 RepID=UPI0033AB3D64